MWYFRSPTLYRDLEDAVLFWRKKSKKLPITDNDCIHCIHLVLFNLGIGLKTGDDTH